MFKPSPDHAHFRLVRRIPHPERLSPLSRRLSFSLPTLIRAKFGQIQFPGVQSILYPTLYFGKIPNHLFETGTVSDPFLHWEDAEMSHSASRRLKCVLNTANDNWLVITDIFHNICSVIDVYKVEYTLQPRWPINCNRYLEQTMKR